MRLLDHTVVKTTALWIKENEKVLNVLAGFFFVLTFLAGVVWVFGREVEPVAFVLSLITSCFFGLPHLAGYILPSRKPVKNMTHDELLQFVKASNPKKDWKSISNDWVSEVFLKEDPRLRFRAKYTDEGIQNDDYQDEWANKYLHPKAVGYWYDLFYDSNLVNRFILVAVDGGRAKLPTPNPPTGKVDAIDYKVAQIHDVTEKLDQYIHLSGLRIDEHT